MSMNHHSEWLIIKHLCCFETQVLYVTWDRDNHYIQHMQSICLLSMQPLTSEASRCTKQVFCQLTLALLLVGREGCWVLWLGLVSLADPCPMVLVLPGMCQPPAAPCQGASQSLFTPEGGSPCKEQTPPTPRLSPTTLPTRLCNRVETKAAFPYC